MTLGVGVSQQTCHAGQDKDRKGNSCAVSHDPAFNKTDIGESQRKTRVHLCKGCKASMPAIIYAGCAVQEVHGLSLGVARLSCPEYAHICRNNTCTSRSRPGRINMSRAVSLETGKLKLQTQHIFLQRMPVLLDRRACFGGSFRRWQSSSSFPRAYPLFQPSGSLRRGRTRRTKHP